jgi:hypothetical protein
MPQQYDANDKVVWGHTTSLKPAIMGRRTAAHLDATIARLRRRHPAARLEVIQSAYNTGVKASAGTHDLDTALDVRIVGLDWWTAQKFLRRNGWAAWYRHQPLFTDHIHMITLGYGTAPVGIYIPGQVDDYYRHAYGLKGQHDSGDDPSWFPRDIDATIFKFGRFIHWHPRWNARHPKVA